MDKAVVNPRNLREGRLDKLMFWSLIAAFALSILTSLGYANWLSRSWLVDLIAAGIPAVDNVANQTRYVAAARVTAASQWLFAPLYVYAFFIPRSPWKIVRPRDEAWRANIRARARKTLFGVAILVWLILADWDVLPGPSFFRGTFWNPTIDISNIPYLGWLGLAVSACLSPWFECLMYWLVAIIVSRYYVASFMHIRNSADTSA